MPLPATDRDRRAATAVSAVALAYLRLVAEGASGRALRVLAEFRQSWNSYAHDVVRSVDPGAPELLRETATYDTPTARAMLAVLVASGWLPASTIMPTQASALPAFYRNRLRGELPASWPAYDIAKTAPLNVMRERLAEWVFGYIEDLLGADDAWLDALAEPGPGAGQCGPGYVLEDGACVYSDELVIPGSPAEGRKQPVWPWVIAGGVLAVAAVGLGVRKWSRR